MKRAAEFDRGLDRLLPIGLVGDVVSDEASCGAEFGCECVAVLLQDVADNDFGTVGHQCTRLGGALSTCTPADQYNSPVEARHRISPLRKVSEQ